MADHLVGGQRPSELLSILCIPASGRAGLHDADGFSAKGRHRAIDHGFDRGQGVAAVAEQGVGRELHIPEFEIAGTAAAEPRKIAQGEAARALRHQEQAELVRLPEPSSTRAETMICPAALPSSTAVLCRRGASRQASSSPWSERRQIEARLTFRMRECQNQRAVGDIWQQRLLRFRAAFRDQRRADHDGREIRLGDEAAPECFHQDADLDRAAAEPAMGLGDRQRQPAEIGELLPDVGAEAERIAGDLAAVIGGIGLGRSGRHFRAATAARHSR